MRTPGTVRHILFPNASIVESPYARARDTRVSDILVAPRVFLVEGDGWKVESETYRSFCRLQHAHIPDKHKGCGHFNFLRVKIYFWKCSIGHFAGCYLQEWPILSTFAGDSKSLKSPFL